MTSPEQPPPQLHMRRVLGELPIPSSPPPYTLRTLVPADAAAWAALLTRNGELGHWDEQRAAPFFTAGGPMPFEQAFCVTCAGVLVATAQLHLHSTGPYAPTPELCWVAVDPAHKGRGLGTLVCAAVLQSSAQAGYRELFLRTDDWRRSAITIYLRLGFQPWLFDPSAAGRWDAIIAQLAG